MVGSLTRPSPRKLIATALTAALVGGLFLFAAPQPAQAQQVQRDFLASTTFTVPTGVTAIDFFVRGGGGGANSWTIETF